MVTHLRTLRRTPSLFDSVHFRVGRGEHVVDLVEDRALGKVEGAVVPMPGGQPAAGPPDLK